MAPERYGKYNLLERIGAGGMAEVWRAKTLGAEGFTKDLVIKRILPKFTSDPEFVRMFIAEARLVARLQHANVVQIFDFDQEKGTYYLAMELVEGRDLRQIEKAAARAKVWCSLPTAVYLIAEACKGLHYAHTRTDHGHPLLLSHRDISPHNILISYTGDVKLTDFGIAKVAEQSGKIALGMVKGKLSYMSPEQISGHSVDGRTDIYSMGVVFWELLTANRLFTGADESEVVRKVREGRVPPPRQFHPDIPEDLEQVVMHMLVRERDQRYQSAGDVVRDLCALSCYAYEAQALGDLVRTLFPETSRDWTEMLHESSIPRPEPDPSPPERIRPVARSNMAGSDQKTMLATPAPVIPQQPGEARTMIAMAPGPVAAPPPVDAAIAAKPGGFAQGAPPMGFLGAPQNQLRGGPSAQATVIAATARPQVAPIELRPASATLRPPPAPMSGGTNAMLWIVGLGVAAGVAGGTYALSRRFLPAATIQAPARPRTGLGLFSHKGQLEVVSKPPGATVLVDGVEQPGQTPMAVVGEIGKQARLKIQAAGFEPFEAVIVFTKEPVPPLSVSLRHPGDRPPGLKPPLPDDEAEGGDAEDPKSAADESRKQEPSAPDHKKLRRHHGH